MTPELRRGIYALPPAELGLRAGAADAPPTIAPREIAIALQVRSHSPPDSTVPCRIVS
jgi:hypothetical protein